MATCAHESGKGQYKIETGKKYVTCQTAGIDRKIFITGRILIMKRLKYLNKIIMTIILVCLVTSCGSKNNMNSDKNNTEESIGEYTISIFDSSEAYDLKWKNNISHSMIRLDYMSDSSLDIVVNESIRNAMISWMNEDILTATSSDLEIYCCSSEYFSFVNRLYYETQNGIRDINDYITIDLKTGKCVMLDDLIKIDAEFVEYIQEHNLLRESINDMKYGASWESLKEYTTDELIDELNECCKTQQQVIKDGDSLIFSRNSFYLRENQLVIVIGYGTGETHYAFDIDDISDFLKTEQ